MEAPDVFAMADGRRIAFRFHAGIGPTVVFLPGYMSDMSGSKATALLAWARRAGRGCLLLDYSGCGESSGDFADGTLTRWQDESVALIDHLVAGPLLLVGSSMGGWLMLLVAEVLASRVAGLVGIAPAPDFTEWGLSSEEKGALHRGEVVRQANPYGPESTPLHPGFWRDAQSRRVLERDIPLLCPARLLHGMRDADVPHTVSLRLAERLGSADVQTTLIKDGDHRLSRDGDIALLLRTVEALVAA